MPMPFWVSIGPSGRSTEQATHNTHPLESGTAVARFASASNVANLLETKANLSQIQSTNLG